MSIGMFMLGITFIVAGVKLLIPGLPEIPAIIEGLWLLATGILLLLRK